MEIGERIKQRRLELNLTVDELAKRLGKNRATIYRYESNDIENFPTTILEPLAKALDTTPAYLMGWEESIPDYTFTLADGSKIIIEYMEPAKQKIAQRLLTYYFKLNEIGQKKALENIEDLSKIYSKEKAYLEPQAAHERTDIEVTDDMRKHDNDIMDDDTFWNK